MQLPLAVSGWGFKDEFSNAALKVEKVEEEADAMGPAIEGSDHLKSFVMLTLTPSLHVK